MRFTEDFVRVKRKPIIKSMFLTPYEKGIGVKRGSLERDSEAPTDIVEDQPVVTCLHELIVSGSNFHLGNVKKKKSGELKGIEIPT